MQIFCNSFEKFREPYLKEKLKITLEQLEIIKKIISHQGKKAKRKVHKQEIQKTRTDNEKQCFAEPFER